MCGQPAASSGTAAASGDTAASSNSFVADGPPRGHGGGTGSAGARADDAGGGGGGENPSRRQPADAQRTRCCRGLTYFSQAMLETGKLPVGAPQFFWAHRWRAPYSKADIAEAILILRQHA